MPEIRATTRHQKIRRMRDAFCLLRAFALLLLAAGVVCAERLPVKIYTSADGLGSSFINATMRDLRGFLWFATRDGLSRFDGHHFTTYQIGEKDAPPGIEQVLETRAGVYWISTTGGTYRFDPRESAAAPVGDGSRAILSARSMGDFRGVLYEDSRGNLWNGGNAAYLVEEKDGKCELRKVEIKLPDDGWQSYGISGFAETADGSLWITTTHGMIRRLPDERLVFYAIDAPAKDNLNASLADDAGRIWFGSGSALYVFKAEAPEDFPAGESVFVRRLDVQDSTVLAENSPLPETAGTVSKFKLADADNRFRRIFSSSNNHVWIAAMKSLVEFDGQRWRIFDQSHGLTAEMIDIDEDTDGNLWLSGQSGAMRLNRSGMTAYGLDDGLRSLAVHSLFFKHGELYAVNGSGFVSRFNGKGFETARLDIEPNSNLLWTSHVGFPDSSGQWWILTGGKLYRFAAPQNFLDLDKRKPLAVYTGADGLKGSLFYRMFEDSKGNLWISTHERDERDDGLTILKASEDKFRIFSESDGFPEGKSLASFAEDASGTAWLGFYQGGLARFRDGRFEEIKGDLPAAFITALHFDRKGRLWIASTQSGVSRVDDPNAAELNFTRLTTGNGLSSNNVRSLVEDENGDIYVGTARGVDRISPDSEFIRHFSINDGLTGDFVVAAERDAEGALWFGTSNGLSRYKPEPEKQKNLPPVWFSGLRIDGERRFVSELGAAKIDNLELAANQNNLQIDFFAVDFSAGGAVRYQHKLERADADWSAPTEQRTVNYSNLAPGAYRFLVRPVSADGKAGEPSATVSFNILAPFWRRWWFITAIVLLFMTGIFALDRYRAQKTRQVRAALEALNESRKARLAELERVRSRIARDLHDDVGSSLTQIALFSEVARQSGNGASREPLDFIASTANELVEAMSDIVWAINPQKDHLHDLTQRMRRFASEIFTAADIDLEFRAPESDSDAPLGANLRREVFLIFKESVNNVVKHAAATKVRIEFRIENGVLILTLQDDGRGFDASAKNDGQYDWQASRGGNGLPGMKKRAAELGGEFFIESKIEQGTTVTLRVPLEKQAEARA
jgi:signal transduction histidine kinase/ligand-binding sensor domain-containing protein